MSEIKFHEFSSQLVETYRRYLFTTNLISDSEPELRQELWDKLSQRDIFALRPLVTSIPAYKQSFPGADLIGRTAPPMLAPSLRKLAPQEFDLNRPLYEHQVEALEITQQGRNLIVATGTGSGKTECFLLPILDDAARHKDDGVRAVIIYPMNALANDQLDRLRRLLSDLPDITFGRYTGDTPRNRQDVSDEVKGKIAANERYTRDEIRERPPHILLTNFAMLEYLLLRPDDADIFRQQSLRFVVLDEAHTYNGAQGIDVSLLMRRLRQTYQHNNLQFILTSATLADGDTPAARERIARFGASISGATFEPADVIFGSTVHGFDEQCREVELADIARAVPDEDALARWLLALDDSAELRLMIEASGLLDKPISHETTAPHALLNQLFRDWLPLRKIHTAVSENPHDLSHLSQLLWGEESRRASLALEWLLIMASHARQHEESAPLLPARFHFFFRGLNGASICLSPQCDARSAHPQTFWSRVYLESRVLCDLPCESRLLPLSTCFQCGMPAVTVWVSQDGKWQPLPPSDKPDEPERRLSLTWDTSLAEAVEEEEEASETEESDVVELCLSCGQFGENRLLFDCCPSPARVRMRNLTPKGGELKQCPRCGTSARPYPSVLRDFRSGEDAATAVLTEQVMRNLPEDSKRADFLPARGRRVLAFSDSRQRAAFFAPYLKRTTAETEYAKPLYDALLLEEKSSDDDPVMLEDVAKRFKKEALKRKLVLIKSYDRERDVVSYEIKPTRQLLPADEKNLQRQAYISLLQHFCASPRQRQNMPGMGLAASEIYLTAGDREDIPSQLPEAFNKGEREGFDLIQQLLQIFLMRRALSIDDESISLEDIGAGPKYATFHYTFNDRAAGRQRYRWNPYAAGKRNRRTVPSSFTASVVGKFFGLNVQEDGKEIDGLLEKIWECLRQTTLFPTAFGGEYQVAAAKIVLTTQKPWYRCEACGRLSVFNISNRCVAPGCEGALHELAAGDMERRFANHHYRHRLLNAEPLALEVAEHTAQLTNTQGQIYQDKFIKGEINVLSSSTTFEMGVDVGQLKAVILRNVPPSASNYIQRAGRAGRRRDGAAYAVTYARSLPHDQFYYHNPEAIVRGKVPVPLINLKNRRLAQRHVNSFLLGRFLREIAPGEKINNVADFFLAPDGTPAPAARFRNFIESNRGALLEALSHVIPAETELSPAECLQASADALDSVGEEKVDAPLESFRQQLGELRERRAQADTSELRKILNAEDSLERLIKQLKNERIIDFLSGAHWLPSYAFPQDTIRLLVRQKDWSQKMRLERDRDVGISEYAPGAEIIADGRLLKSRGVLRPNQGFDVRQYSYCRNCRRLVTKLENEAMERVCECGLTSQPRNYIKPEGFQTLYSDEVVEPNLYRVRPPSNSELFLVSGARPEDFRAHELVAGVTYGYRRDGKLFRANPGFCFQQFRLCKTCGVSFDDKKKPMRPHQTPWGTNCFGAVFRTHLAHEFETDTLQLRFDEAVLKTPDVTEQDFWLSFQTAFVSAAAETLAIPRADLDVTYQSQSSASREGEMIIYDRVPGGAGYVRRIIENLPQILERTLNRTRACDNPLCDLEGSCYTCLRSYGNQFYWDRLKRRRVSEWLQTFIGAPKLDAGTTTRASLPDEAASRVAELRAYCDARCQPLLEFCVERGLSLPAVGFELEDSRGAVAGDAELAWPERKLAVFLPEQAASIQPFKEAGWSVYLLEELTSRMEVLAAQLKR